MGWDPSEAVGARVLVPLETDADALLADLRSTLRVLDPTGVQVPATISGTPLTKSGAASDLFAFWLEPVTRFAEGWHDIRFETAESFNPEHDGNYRVISPGVYGATFTTAPGPPPVLDLVRTCAGPFLEVRFTDFMKLGSGRQIADSVLVIGIDPPASYPCSGAQSTWGDVFDPSTAALAWYLSCGEVTGRVGLTLSGLVSGSGVPLSGATSVVIDLATAPEVDGCRTFEF